MMDEYQFGGISFSFLSISLADFWWMDVLHSILLSSRSHYSSFRSMLHVFLVSMLLMDRFSYHDSLISIWVLVLIEDCYTSCVKHSSD